MYLVITVLVLFVAFGIYHAIRGRRRRWYYGLEDWFMDMAVTAFILFLVSGFTSMIFIPEREETVSVSRQNLEAVALNSGVDGSFFLGSGYVDDELVYTYAARADDGSISVRSIDADEAKIFDDTETSPYIERIKTRTVAHPWSFIQIYDNLAEVHVPAGSVVQTYDIDVREG